MEGIGSAYGDESIIHLLIMFKRYITYIYFLTSMKDEVDFHLERDT